MDKSAVQGYFPGNHWLYFSVYLFTFLTGLPLNLLALIVFVGKLRRRPLAVDVLLLNLTVSDLLLLVFLPFRMVETASAMYWTLPSFLCPLSGFVFFTTIYLSSLLLTAVSVERFLGVTYPVWYKTQSRIGQAGWVSVGCWLLGSAHCSTVYIAEFWEGTIQKQEPNRTCYLDLREEQLAVVLPFRLETAVVLFGVPLVLVSYCYGKMIWILRKGNSLKRRKRVMGLIGAMMLNFLVCFGPYNASHVIGYFQGKSPKWRGYVLLLSTLNSCVDPLVFYFSSSGFQRDFHRLFRNLGKTSGPWGRNELGIQERNGPEKKQSTC